MNRINIVALAFLASASLSTANAASKKDKVVKNQPVAINTAADSLSYATGLAATQGLLPFLQKQYNLDTAYVDDFIAGYEEAMQQCSNAKGKARIAGMQIAQMVTERILPGEKEQLKNTNLPINEDVFNKGFIGALKKDTSVFASAEKAAEYKKDIQSALGTKWLAENSKKPGVVTLPDGLQYKVLVAGNGEKPKKSDEVEVIYEGKLIDGTVFDATYKHLPNKKDKLELKPDKFKAGNLIKGWTEALTMMPVGSKWEIYVPQELGYGERAAGKIPPFSTLIFTLELKSIVVPPAKVETDKTVTSNTAPVSATSAKKSTLKSNKTANKK